MRKFINETRTRKKTEINENFTFHLILEVNIGDSGRYLKINCVSGLC